MSSLEISGNNRLYPLAQNYNVGAAPNAEEKVENSKDRKREGDSAGKNSLEQSKMDTDIFVKSSARNAKQETVYYSAGRDLARIAQANSITQVKLIVGGIQSKMKKVKNSKAGRLQISRAVFKMKRVIGRGQVKVYCLQKESAMEKQRSQAAAAKNERQERELVQALKRRRSVRKNRENGEILDIGDVVHTKAEAYEAAASSSQNVQYTQIAAIPEISAPASAAVADVLANGTLNIQV